MVSQQQKIKIKKICFTLVTNALVHSLYQNLRVDKQKQEQKKKKKKINFCPKKVNLTHLSDVPEPDLGMLLSIDVGLVVDNAHQIP
jgi:hypothetical protein